MGSQVTLAPQWPEIGLPEGTKEQGQRVDFRNKQFDLLIETKGTRLAWTRAAICPCTPVNTQTEQPNPNCDLCGGHGWFYFGPDDPAPAAEVGELTALQQKIVDDSNAAIIRGVLLGLEREHAPFERSIGRWVSGTAQVTVRQGNRIAYYDKLVALDSVMAYNELIQTVAGNVLPTRYPVVRPNYLRSESTVYQLGVDYEAVEGELRWRTGKAPAVDTRVMLHYLVHPVWLVKSHPHITRLTIVKQKQQTVSTPRGTPIDLPIQATVQYDWVP